MNETIGQMIAACEWAPSRFLIFSDNVFAPFIYYSHFSALVVSMVVGFFIFFNGRKVLANNILFSMMLFFAAWIFADLVLWATEIPKYTMFFWSLINLFEPFVYYLAFYFVYVFLKDKDLSIKTKIISFLPMLPIIILTPTAFAILGYNLVNCDRAAVEGVMAFYGYAAEIFYVLLAVIIMILHIRRFKKDNKKVLVLFFGIVFFLVSFSLGNIVESITDNWYVGQIGLIGAPVFAAVLAYLIVKFHSFQMKLIATQALTVSLWVLVLSLLFIRKIENIRVAVVATLVLMAALGYQLIRSVKREIEQREEIERLAQQLEDANEHQVTLIHFITHQVKSFLTKSRYIFGELEEGTYGQLTPEAKTVAHQGLAFNTEGVNMVQNVLHAANIKTGKVTYEKKPLDFKKLVETEVEKQRKVAEEKGLTMTLEAQPGEYHMDGDADQLSHAVLNLIDNAIKYTLKGTVAVALSTRDAMIRLAVTDSGIGISDADKPHLFTEGGRGEDSQKINVDSTGYGLFIVKGIIEAHGGKIWYESEGRGKGTTFFVEVPGKQG